MKKNSVRSNRKSKRAAKPQQIARLSTGPPLRMNTRLQYTSLYVSSNAVAATTSSVQTFRLNSLFDPDYTNVGHQPLYYDQLAPTLYQFYRVLWCDVNLRFVNTTTAPTTVIVYVSTLPAPSYPNPQTAVELPNSESLMLAGVNAGGAMRSWRKKVVIAPHFGVSSKALKQEDDFAAGYAANPVNTLYLHIWTCGLTAAGSVQVQADLLYNSWFFELTNPTGS